MRRAVVAHAIVLNLLACPLLCRGLAAGFCSGACCDREERQPARRAPAEPADSDPCDSSRTSCICTGATTLEEVRDFDQLLNVWSQPAFADAATTARSSVLPTTVAREAEAPPVAISGAAVRALHQSYLL